MLAEPTCKPFGPAPLTGRVLEELKLHYPPNSLLNAKEGDQITVHLAFSEGHGAAGMQEGVGSATGVSPKGEAPLHS
jgi:hypothetical protein